MQRLRREKYKLKSYTVKIMVTKLKIKFKCNKKFTLSWQM